MSEFKYFMKTQRPQVACVGAVKATARAQQLRTMTDKGRLLTDGKNHGTHSITVEFASGS